MVKIGRGLLFEFERTCIYTWVNLNLKLVCALSFALAAPYWCMALLIFSLLKFCCPFRYTTASCHKKCRFCDKIISLPLVSGIMLLCSASLYMLMLTLGIHRPDCSVCGLAIFIFMMKCELSCLSLELLSHLAQPVCLNKHRGGCSFPLPNQLQIFSTHPFHSYFWTKHPHLLFPLQS